MNDRESIVYVQTLWIAFISLGTYITLLYGIIVEKATLSYHMQIDHRFTVAVSFFMSMVFVMNFAHLLIKNRSSRVFVFAWGCNCVSLLSWFGVVLFEWNDSETCSLVFYNPSCHFTFTTLFVVFSMLFVLHVFEDRRYYWLGGLWIACCVVTIVAWLIMYYSNDATAQSYVSEYLTLFVYNTFWTIYMVMYILPEDKFNLDSFFMCLFPYFFQLNNISNITTWY